MRIGGVCLFITSVLLAGCESGSVGPKPDGGPNTDLPKSDAPVTEAGKPDKGPAITLPYTTPGCEPACAKGQVCRAGTCELAGIKNVCASGDKWPVGLPTSNVFYVDTTVTTTGDGSKDKPFKTITEAMTAVAGGPGGSTVAVASGAYDEAVAINQSLTLSCACAKSVTIKKPVTVSSAGSDLKVTIDGCTIAPSDTPTSPTCPTPDATTGLKVTGEDGKDVDLLIKESSIAGWCTGLHFRADPATTSSLCVHRSRIWMNRWGVGATKAPTNATSPFTECQNLPGGIDEALVVNSSQIDQNEFGGVFAHTNASGVAVHASLLEKQETKSSTTPVSGMGVYLLDMTSVHLISNLIQYNRYEGIAIRDGKKGATKTAFVISKNTLVENKAATMGLRNLVTTAPIEFKDNYVEKTLLEKQGDFAVGDGVHVVNDANAPFQVNVTGNKLTGCERHSIFLHAVNGSVDGNTIVKSGMCGIHVQESTGVTMGTNVINASGMFDVTVNPEKKEDVSAMPLPPPRTSMPLPPP